MTLKKLANYFIYAIIPAVLIYLLFIMIFTVPFSFVNLLYILFIIGVLRLLFVCFNRSKLLKSQKNSIIFYLLFYLYLCLMVHFLFLSSDFARDPTLMMHTDYRSALIQQWENGTNFIPFETIKRMQLIFYLDYYDDKIAVINLLGNFIAFMPFSFFTLKLFHKYFKKPLNFIFWTAFIIILVEAAQLFTLTGSCDIDDFILNFSGALLAYILLRIMQFFAKK